MTNTPIWTPSSQLLANSRMAKFINWVNQHHQLEISDYHQLHQWSVRETSNFWDDVAKFLSFHWQQQPQTPFIEGSTIQQAKWFSGGKFNFAENLLSHEPEDTAITTVDEQGNIIHFTWHELIQQVAACAAGLKAAGVKQGDRVVGVLPNNHYPVIAMLATASIGAIWASCSPDFGSQAIIDRLGQSKPAVCFLVDGHFYHGKTHSAIEKIDIICQSLTSVRQFVLCPHIGIDIEDVDGMTSWQQFLIAQDTLDFAHLPFNHPLYVLFTSGTTGRPKCMVHSAGGTLIQHMKELALHCDIHAGDNLCFYTTTGWMMWNWMVSALSLGCRLTLYEGSPTYPNHQHVFKHHSLRHRCQIHFQLSKERTVS